MSYHSGTLSTGSPSSHGSMRGGLLGAGGGRGGGGYGDNTGSAGSGLQLYTLASIRGKVLAMAREQNSCRMLQARLETREPAFVDTIFRELLPHAFPLSIEPFGNYLFQRLLEALPPFRHSLLVLVFLGVLSADAALALDVSGDEAGLPSVQQAVASIRARAGGTVVGSLARAAAAALASRAPAATSSPAAGAAAAPAPVQQPQPQQRGAPADAPPPAAAADATSDELPLSLPVASAPPVVSGAGGGAEGAGAPAPAAVEATGGPLPPSAADSSEPAVAAAAAAAADAASRVVDAATSSLGALSLGAGATGGGDGDREEGEAGASTGAAATAVEAAASLRAASPSAVATTASSQEQPLPGGCTATVGGAAAAPPAPVSVPASPSAGGALVMPATPAAAEWGAARPLPPPNGPHIKPVLTTLLASRIEDEESWTTLTRAALDMQGTRSVQRILETVTAAGGYWEPLLVECLTEPGAVQRLACDANGNHVLARGLQCLSPTASAHLADALSGALTFIVRHRHGCAVVQRALEVVRGAARSRLLAAICDQCLSMMVDPYSNYVIQFAMANAPPAEASAIMRAARGYLAALAMHKFSSNVIERCLQHAGDDNLRGELVDELCGLLPSRPLPPPIAALAARATQQHQQQQHELGGGRRAGAKLGGGGGGGGGDELPWALSASSLQHIDISATAIIPGVTELNVTYADAAPLDPVLSMQAMLLDTYGNYVVQRMVAVSSPRQMDRIMYSLQPHLGLLATTPSGRRVANKILKRYPELQGIVPAPSAGQLRDDYASGPHDSAGTGGHWGGPGGGAPTRGRSNSGAGSGRIAGAPGGPLSSGDGAGPHSQPRWPWPGAALGAEGAGGADGPAAGAGRHAPYDNSAAPGGRAGGGRSRAGPRGGARPPADGLYPPPPAAAFPPPQAGGWQAARGPPFDAGGDAPQQTYLGGGDPAAMDSRSAANLGFPPRGGAEGGMRGPAPPVSLYGGTPLPAGGYGYGASPPPPHSPYTASGGEAPLGGGGASPPPRHGSGGGARYASGGGPGDFSHPLFGATSAAPPASQPFGGEPFSAQAGGGIGHAASSYQQQHLHHEQYHPPPHARPHHNLGYHHLHEPPAGPFEYGPAYDGAPAGHNAPGGAAAGPQHPPFGAEYGGGDGGFGAAASGAQHGDNGYGYQPPPPAPVFPHSSATSAARQPYHAGGGGGRPGGVGVAGGGGNGEEWAGATIPPAPVGSFAGMRGDVPASAANFQWAAPGASSDGAFRDDRGGAFGGSLPLGSFQ